MLKVFLLFSFFFIVLTGYGQLKKWVVAQDGSGNFKTVQAAFDAIQPHNKIRVIIYIRNGVYNEKLHLDSAKNNVILVGQDKEKTILNFDDHTGKVRSTGDTINTYTSASFLIKADNFSAKNITFSNNAGFAAGQAVAVAVQGDKALFFNCRFVGFQDVLFAQSAYRRQYYKSCYIEGTTDFIFGAATVLFEDCIVYSKKNSHVTAASTPQNVAYGFVFKNCRLEGDSGLHNVSLGRPWQPYASVTYINCYIGQHIIPQGWNNWKNEANEKTARYAEYKNYGPGATVAQRVKWSRQLTDKEVAAFTTKNIFGSWRPAKQLKALWAF